jgi:hypothetical protein
LSEIFGNQVASKALQSGDSEIARLAAVALAGAGDPRGIKVIADRLGEDGSHDEYLHRRVSLFVEGLVEDGDAAVDALIPDLLT